MTCRTALTVLFASSTFFWASTGLAEDCEKGARLRGEGTRLPAGSTEQEEKFRQGVSECPSLAELHYDLGVNLSAQGRLDEALDNFKAAAKLEPDPTFLFAVGSTLARKGELSAAGDEFRKSQERYPKDTRPLVGLAMIAAESQDLPRAEELIRQAIQLNPKDGSLFYNLGVVLERQLKLEEALTSYEAALDKDRDNAEVLVRVGELRLRLGKVDQAEKILEQVTLIDSRSVRAWTLLANVRAAKRKKKEALDAIQRAAQITSDDPSVLRTKGILLVETGAQVEGLNLLSAAVQRFPRDAELRAGYGFVLLKERKLDEAQREFETALSIDPNNGPAHHNLGVIFEERGQPEQAAKHFELASGVNPAGPGAGK